jgi:hypothetical protein
VHTPELLQNWPPGAPIVPSMQFPSDVHAAQ